MINYLVRLEQEILLVLLSGEKHTKGLTKLLDTQHSSVHKPIQSLIRRGLVSSIIDPKNPRRNVYSLTPKGELLAQVLLLVFMNENENKFINVLKQRMEAIIDG